MSIKTMKPYQTLSILVANICLSSIFFFSCSKQNDIIGYHTYEFTGNNNFVLDFFTLNLQSESPYIDELHKLNPDVFVATDSTKSIWDIANEKYFIKSTITGTVYECKLKRGTTIRLSPIEAKSP